MIHVAYQPRTVPGERRDCALRALCAVSGASYDAVWAQFKSLGRRKGCATYVRCMKEAIKERQLLQWGSAPVMRAVCLSGTLAKFIQNYPRGRYLVWVSGHFVAVIDGHCWDFPGQDWDKLERKRVKWAMRYA